MQFGAGSVSQLTLGYNIARLHEANGELRQAETVYEVSQTSWAMQQPACCIMLTSKCASKCSHEHTSQQHFDCSGLLSRLKVHLILRLSIVVHLHVIFDVTVPGWKSLI